MKLYKNIDIKDLESILTKGILSIDKLGFDNWAENHRANNDTNVVYLQKPLTNVNSFNQYGLVLLEIETDNAKSKEIDASDRNNGKYQEFIVDEVKPNQIIKAYIPKCFSDYVEIENDKIKYVDFNFKIYEDDVKVSKNSIDDGEIFDTVENINTNEFNYLRGINANNWVVDFYDFEYLI